MAPAPPPHSLHIESVGFSPGTGRLVRRATAVLFDATGANTKLTSGFDDAASDADAVAFALATLVESELGLSPFAIVQWSGDLEMLVFGDLELHSSVPTAPMITGGDSQTWVEHRVPRHLLTVHPSLQVWSGEAPEPGTNLRLGIAVSSGFRLNLVFGPAPVVERAPVAPPSRTTVEQHAVSPEPAPVEPAPAVEPEPALEVEPVQPHDHDDTDADPFATAASAMSADRAPANDGALLQFDPFEPEPAIEPEPEAAPEISTWIDDAPDSTTPDSTTPEPSDGPGEAFCVNGHANPISSSSCFSCGSSIVTAPAAGGSLPGVGRLVFDLRDDVVITGAATIGRKPAADGHADLIVIDHPEVSRSHASISIDGWAVTLTDLESRNGTWVHPPTDEGLRRLDPGERVVLVDGTIVHLGSVDVCFTWIAGSDA